MSILDKTGTKTVPKDTQSKAAIESKPQVAILTTHPDAGKVPPELMAAALNTPANVHAASYARGMKDGHAAAMAAHGGNK